jgi:hypothetical protein
MSFTSQAQLRQSALKGAAEVIGALVNAKVIKTVDDARQGLFGLRDELFADLKAIADAEPKQESSSGGGRSNSRYSKTSDADKLKDALSTAMRSGPFQGETMGAIFGFDQEQAESFKYTKGTGRDYIAFLATERNPNEYTRRRAAAIVDAAKDGKLSQDTAEPEAASQDSAAGETGTWGV